MFGFKNLKELIQGIAQAMVDNPGEVLVSEVEGRQTTILGLKVAKNDVGKIIGRRGRNAEALRIIINSVAAKNNRHAQLEIIE